MLFEPVIVVNQIHPPFSLMVPSHYQLVPLPGITLSGYRISVHREDLGSAGSSAI